MGVMAKTWVMVMAMKLAGNKEGKAKGGKGDGDSNDGGRRQRGQGREVNYDGNRDKGSR